MWPDSCKKDRLACALQYFAVGQMEVETVGDGYLVLIILQESTATCLRSKGHDISRLGVCDGHDIQTSLRQGTIQICCSQQPMTLRPNKAHLEYEVVRQLALDGEVVLVRVLRAHMGLELAKQQNRPER